MKICAAQIQSYKNNVGKNIEKHRVFVEAAISGGSDLIVFPELSLTGYEPELVKGAAIFENDQRIDVFQKMSNERHITISLGAPVKSGLGIKIGMVLFEPGKTRHVYSKQYLHEDELRWFIQGDHQTFLTIGNQRIAPAICYESMQAEHIEKVMKSETDVYMASVAKSAGGVKKAYDYFPEIAGKYSIVVIMVNSVGPCDDFICAGSSAVWGRNGNLLGRLNEKNEGILIYDTETESITIQAA
jgi:predicted amidohydrolase